MGAFMVFGFAKEETELGWPKISGLVSVIINGTHPGPAEPYSLVAHCMDTCDGGRCNNTRPVQIGLYIAYKMCLRNMAGPLHMAGSLSMFCF